MTGAASERSADLVLTGGKIITVDPQFSIAKALAVSGERISAVGDAEDVGVLAGAATKIIDLRGRAVIPGMIDGHAHMDREGLKSVFPSLEGCASIREIQDRIEALVSKARPGEWLVTMPIGDPPSYWNVPDNLKERRFPTRWELDEVSPDNPVYIRPIWGFWRHILPLVSVANSKALDIAGLGRDATPPCEGIEYGRDNSGELNGLFIENAYIPTVELVLFPSMPRFTHDQRVSGMPHAMEVYNASGITGVFEEHGAAQELVQAYQAFRATGGMTVRTHLVYSPSWLGLGEQPFSPVLQSWAGWLGHGGIGDDWLRIEGMYTSFGISPQNKVRAQALPYTGWSGFNYSNGVPRERMTEFLIEAARNGIRISAILIDLLDYFEEVNKVVPIADKRWVIGHINTITPDQIARIKDLGLVLTTHTTRYIHRQGHLTRAELGEGRENEISPLRSLLDAGVPIALATDNSPPSLFHSMWHAITRRNRYVNDLIAADQAITREEALRCATINGAWLTLSEKDRGSIEPGKLADLAVLSADPLTCAEDDLRDIASEMTIVGGRVVFERAPA